MHAKNKWKVIMHKECNKDSYGIAVSNF